MTNVYEIRDISDGERHYNIGVFLSFDDAKSILAEMASGNAPISLYADKSEIIAIVKKPIGMNYDGHIKLITIYRSIQRKGNGDNEIVWATDKIHKEIK